MSLLLIAALTLTFLGGLAAVVIAVLVFAREDGPREAPTWLGPSPPKIEAALRSTLDQRREIPLFADAAVVELARHHAFDMATRGFCADEDPEGVGLGGRRLRLHPNLVGHLQQWIATGSGQGSLEVPEIAAELLAGCGDLTPLDDERWNVLGVGVAVERGRLACCLVAGERWASLDHKVRGNLSPSGWTVEGVVEPGTEVSELGVRLADPAAPVRPATAVDGPVGRFQLHLDEAPGSGLEVQVVKGEAAGVRRPI